MKFTNKKIKELAKRMFVVMDENTKREMIIDQLESHLENLSDKDLQKEWDEMIWKEMAAEEDRMIKEYYPDIL